MNRWPVLLIGYLMLAAFLVAVIAFASGLGMWLWLVYGPGPG